MLGRGLEQQLHAEADAQQRHAGGDALDQLLAEAAGLEVAHRLRKRADAGQHDRGGVADVGRDHGLRAHVRQRLLHAAAVAHAVVGDRDHEFSVPFVDGTPVSSGSIETAARSARANALKQASIMWWAFVPACRSMCSVSRAAPATARKNSSARSWSNPLIPPDGSRSKPVRSAYGRPEMSSAHIARDSSIGTTACP